MNIFHKIAEVIKKFCGKAESAIRNWLLDCLDAVDGEAYRQVSYDCAVWHKHTIDMVSRMRSITVSIPSTVAPWYEDEMFSKKIWDRIRDCGVATFETSNDKWANVIVITTDELDR